MRISFRGNTEVILDEDADAVLVFRKLRTISDKGPILVHRGLRRTGPILDVTAPGKNIAPEQQELVEAWKATAS
ncbi:hypothetical protein I6B53_00065 [Schaalia sp. 19OD2882]|uniref:hypothetical protein n=1 Tax=Schaalia sp. 19OD2882 TaxID=2794089 RepID=UPI001C1ECFCD|nr:hypothetical protein [Schaalia sp. 19OD2882]QWW19584.1 hypothetical protein I6B53_00065 [Schaalia sp. 19OD2882]